MTDPLEQQMARQFVQSDQFDRVLSIFTEIESETVEAVQDLAAVTDGVDGVSELPSPEDRRDMLRELSLAVISGEFPTWYVERLAPVENSEEAAKFIGADPDVLAERWADRLRDRGIEGDDRELATAYARTRYGVAEFVEFRDIVIEWDEDRIENEIEAVVAENFETAQETATAAADAIDDG
ncbi:hypothetical protein [Halostella sp. PRR32]|uniref:hypothetical protein n=1 Tax=Halostella sp. PRR32 TaxID=3098147 RepID=UPI002B1E8877|nr:hypothetical protein [Halostella sp. PRR32]